MGQNAMPICCQPMLAEELDVVVMVEELQHHGFKASEPFLKASRTFLFSFGYALYLCFISRCTILLC